jgi:Ca2+-binding RTX toxin-like protein
MIETLESRVLLSVLSKGVLKITGTNRADYISVSQRKAAVFVSISGRQEHFKLKFVKQIQISGLKGNDDIQTSGKLPGMSISGGLGNDTVVGADRPDTIHGNEGKDLIYGLGGNDQIFADAANDMVSGGEGNDLIDGGSGNDSMTGDNGNDVIHGGDGDDWISAGNECQWGTEHAIHTCGPTAAGTDDDLILGEGGSDHLYASKGMDTLNGADGDDFFVIQNIAPELAAVVDGGEGNDVIGKKGSGTVVSNVEVFQ